MGDTKEVMDEEEKLNVDPVKMFKDDVHDENIETRLFCIKNLGVLAKALGPERTVSELMPALTEWFENAVEDELLYTGAKVLGDFMPYLGDHTNGKHVFRILQMLCATEETIVRDTAVESASKIARQMSPADSVNMLSKAVKELSEANWFTPRVSACGLLPVMFERLNLLSDDDSKDGKAQCISIFTSFCNETMPMVRRAAAKVLSDFASKIKSNDMILNDVMPLITKLLHDESTAVQEITVEHIPTISKLMDEESSKKYMLPIVTSCVSSPSWRRRRAVARGMHSIGVSMGKETAIESILPLTKMLLHDTEREVSSEAVTQLPGLCSLVGTDKFRESLLSDTLTLLNDSSIRNKDSLAEATIKLLPLLPKEMCDPVLDFMQLEETHCTLKTMIVSRLSEFGEVLGTSELRDTFVPEILKLLSQDHQWRMRREIVSQIPALTEILGDSYFMSHLVEPMKSRLDDDSEAVRKAAISVICKMALQLKTGKNWLMDQVVPQTQARFDDSKTHYDRMVVMRLIKEVCKTGLSEAANKLYVCWSKACKNPIPNLKIAAADIYPFLLPLLSDDEKKEEAKGLVIKLCDDDDVDVAFMANRSIARSQSGCGDDVSSKESEEKVSDDAKVDEVEVDV